MDSTIRRHLAEQDTGSAHRRFASRQAEAPYGAPGPINQSRPNQDTQNQTSASLHSLNTTARVVLGIITDCTAIGNAYRVQFEKVKQPVVAFLGSRTTNSIFGVRELNTLQPGTQVTCIWHEQLPYAQIISTMPPPGTESRKNQHSIIHGASRNRVDEAHKRPFRLENNGYIPAWLSGRPFDATSCGETGWITETGLKAFVDSFMAMFGVDEGCQITFHYHDMLCRLAAQQFQLWTAVRETESFNDQDESQDWTGYSMFPWENMGLAARADPTLIKHAQQWQIDEPWYGKMEPLDDHMMPWHREREFHGYLGQGGKHCVVAPPVEFTSDGDQGSSGSTDVGEGSRTEFASYLGGDGVTDAKHPGQFDHFVTADGRALFQSAKGFMFVKRAAIMLPTRRRRPEEPDGDNPQNYKFSGVLGGGPDHKITGDIQTSGEHTGFNRAMGALDMHAYFFNYAGIHPFFYHAEDYKLYEEQDAQWSEGKSEEVPNYNSLASEAYIDPEEYRKTWKIDHRYGEQQFYTLSCGFEFLDDGGVMISDGYGGSIRMIGGSVEIAAPGDVWMKAGRNTNMWAGRDVILRAKHSADITATERDVRIKSEMNTFMLSGNGGLGGTLIESRGSGPIFDFEQCGEEVKVSGVVLRATKSQVVNWARDIYLRTGGPDFSGGPIMLDADKGKAPLTTYSQVIQNYVNTGVFWHFNTIDGETEGPSASITDSGELFPGDMCVGGGIIADGGGIFNGSVVTTEAFASVEGCPFVGCLEGEALQAVLEAIAECNQLMYYTVPQEVGATFYDEVLTPLFYDDERPGNDDVILKAEVSLRIQEDYKTENFKIYEDRWQQLGRITGKAGAKWEENPVLCQGQETYPYPGKEAFESGSNFIQQDLEIFDAQAGRSKDRGGQPSLSGPYSDPKFATPKPASLNEYTVIPRG